MLLPPVPAEFQIKLRPGRYGVPHHYGEDELEQLINLVTRFVPGIEDVVILPWTALPLTVSVHGTRSIVAIRVPSGLSEAAIETALRGFSNVGYLLLQWPDARGDGSTGWVENVLKRALFRCLASALASSTHVLSSYDVRALPVGDAAMMTDDPLDLLWVVQRAIDHRVQNRGLGVRAVDWARSVRVAVGERLADRLSSGVEPDISHPSLSEAVSSLIQGRVLTPRAGQILEESGVGNVMDLSLAPGALARSVHDITALGGLFARLTSQGFWTSAGLLAPTMVDLADRLALVPPWWWPTPNLKWLASKIRATNSDGAVVDAIRVLRSFVLSCDEDVPFERPVGPKVEELRVAVRRTIARRGSGKGISPQALAFFEILASSCLNIDAERPGIDLVAFDAFVALIHHGGHAPFGAAPSGRRRTGADLWRLSWEAWALLLADAGLVAPKEEITRPIEPMDNVATMQYCAIDAMHALSALFHGANGHDEVDADSAGDRAIRHAADPFGMSVKLLEGAIALRDGAVADALSTGVHLSSELDDVYFEVARLHLLANAQLCLGLYDEARTNNTEALALCATHDLQFRHAALLHQRSMIHMVTGDLGAAARDAAESLRLGREQGFRVLVSRARIQVARIAELLGDLDAAMTGWLPMLDERDAHDNLAYVAAALHAMRLASHMEQDELAARCLVTGWRVHRHFEPADLSVERQVFREILARRGSLGTHTIFSSLAEETELPDLLALEHEPARADTATAEEAR